MRWQGEGGCERTSKPNSNYCKGTFTKPKTPLSRQGRCLTEHHDETHVSQDCPTVSSTTDSEGARPGALINAQRQSSIIDLVTVFFVWTSTAAMRQCLTCLPARAEHLNSWPLLLCYYVPDSPHIHISLQFPHVAALRECEKRRRPTFSYIPSQHSYSPANLPVTFLPCFMTRSTSLISLRLATRNYRVGWARLSMSSTHSPRL